MSTARVNITDRAKRYRAQNAVTGQRKCVLCGSRSDLGVMHLDGNESHGEPANLAYGCRSCNGKLAAAFKRIGAGRPTNQYNPSSGVPTFAQYAWAVSNHARGSHDEGGAVIHATPKHKRIEYARRIAAGKTATMRERDDERWNPAETSTAREACAQCGSSQVFKGTRTCAQCGATGKQRTAGTRRNPGSDYEVTMTDHFGKTHTQTVFAESSGGARAAALRDMPSSWKVTRVQSIRKSNPWPFSRPDARRTTPAHGGIAFHQGKMKPSRKRADDLNAEFLKSTKAKGKKAASSMPDEAALQAGFKRGLSLREILGNPAMKDQAVYFGGTRYWRRVLNVKRSKDGAISGTVKFAGKDWKVYLVGGPGGHWDTSRGNPGWDGSFGGEDIPLTARQRNEDALTDIERKMGIGRQGTKAWWALYKRKQKLVHALTRSNPAAASAEVFEEFHGFEPSEVVTVTKHIHHHEHLAAAGKLVSLDVWGIDDKGHKISGFKGSLLAFNETKNQLFVEGGDQSIDLADFGIDSPHELETLGRLTDIGYQTNKTHLGDEGGEAVYVHKFRSTNRDGKHVIVKIARYPDLIYDVRNEQLLFSGGSYEILREGINK